MTYQPKMSSLLSTAACVLAIGAYPLPVQAQSVDAAPQTTPPQPARADEAGEESALPSSDGDIIVTAQRREQRLQNAPVAVTALSAAALEQLNVQTTQSLMQVVPGLQVTTQSAGDSGGSATFFVRGMGQQLSTNGTEPAIGVYVDDFYYPSLFGTIFDIVDLAQVEVLRGPQGTLFGRNTIGGAIRYTTKGAELGRFSGQLTGTLGSYDRREITGAINVPIGDFAALRVTAGHLERDGYVRIQTTGEHAGRTTTDLVRLQARIEPTSSIYADLSATYSDFRLDGFTYNVPGPLTPRPPAAGTAPTLPFIYNNAVAPALGLPLYTDAFRSTCFYCQFGTSVPEYSETRYQNALATIGWDFAPGLSLKSLTGWQDVRSRFRFDLDSTPLPIFGGAIVRNLNQSFSQELQLNGNLLERRLNFVAGAYYYNERINRGNDVPTILLGRPLPLTSDQRNLKSYAGYVDASFKLTDKLSLLGGYRYSEDHKTVVSTDANGVVLATGEDEFPSSTYRAGLQYQWTDDIMTYANVASGFRGGGFNAFNLNGTPPLPAFGPEEATSYETGARLQFLNRRITINPTAFYVDWSRIQVQSVAFNTNTGDAVITVQNAGQARSYGFELEWSVGVTEQLRLFGNLAYLNLRYTDIGNAVGITEDSEFQKAPPLTFALGAAHTIEFGSGAKVITTVNYSFQDDQRSVPTDAQTLQLRAYDLMNARIDFTPAGGRFSVAAYVTNVFDQRYAIGGVNYYADIGAGRFDLGRPREFGVTTRVSF